MFAEFESEQGGFFHNLNGISRVVKKSGVSVIVLVHILSILPNIPKLDLLGVRGEPCLFGFKALWSAMYVIGAE